MPSHPAHRIALYCEDATVALDQLEAVVVTMGAALRVDTVEGELKTLARGISAELNRVLDLVDQLAASIQREAE